MRRPPLLGLARFHLRSAVRVTLRRTVGQVVVVPMLVGLSPDPTAVLSRAALAAASGDQQVLLLLALWLSGNAAAARGPLGAAHHGWHRQLPLSPQDRRRAALLAMSICQAPVTVLALLLWGFGAALTDSSSIAWTMPAAIVALGLTTSIASGRWAASAAAMVGLIGATAIVFGGQVGLAISVVLLVAFDWFGPSPAASDSKSRASGPPRRHRADGRRAWLLPWRLTWRAVGARKIWASWAWAAIALAAVVLFTNNNELSREQEAIGVRVGAGIATLAILVPIASALRESRPPWPWLRSLPASSRDRLLLDAGFLAILSVPVLLVASAMALRCLPPLLAMAGWQSIRLASALRVESDGITRLEPTAIGEAWLAQMMVAAWPSVGWLALPAAVLAMRHGGRLEQRMKVSTFRERFTSLLGDSRE